MLANLAPRMEPAERVITQRYRCDDFAARARPRVVELARPDLRIERQDTPAESKPPAVVPPGVCRSSDLS